MRLLLVLLLLVLFVGLAACPVHAQVTFQEQVSLLRLEDGTSLVLTSPIAGRSVGVRFRVASDKERVHVFPEEPPFRPRPLDRAPSGLFVLEGRSGEAFWVWDGEDFDRLVIELEDPPPVDPDPVDPPPERDWSAIEDVIAETMPVEPEVQRALAECYREAIDRLKGSDDLAHVRSELTFSRRNCLKGFPVIRGDWNGFLHALVEVLDEIDSASVYLDAFAFLADRMGGAKPQETVEFSTVKMYSPAGCDLCEQWKANVLPKLTAAKWRVEIHPGDSLRFVVCAYSQCCEHVGYMSLNDFKSLVSAMEASKNTVYSGGE